MAFGAVFHNDSGMVQIDDQRAVLSLMSCGTDVATVSMGSYGTTCYKVLTFTGRTAPLLAIGVDKPAMGDKGFQIVKTERSGSTWSFTVAVWHSHNGDFAFRWYLFDLPWGTTPSGWGMALWDASGRCTFSTDYPPARVTATMVAGRSYAAINGGPLAYQENFDWDSEEQQEIITWQLSCYPLATYIGAGSMNGAIDGAVDWQAPTIPWLTAPNISAGPQILFDVTGYLSASGPPSGFDWLVHPTTGDQLTWQGDNLVWPV